MAGGSAGGSNNTVVGRNSCSPPGCTSAEFSREDISLTTTVDKAYSPKMTCMGTSLTGCHTTEEYGSTLLKTVTKTQGILDSNGEVNWQSYNVHAHAHGTVVGRHSQQGRNEDYSIEMKTTFKDAFFTSSPGMFGKY